MSLEARGVARRPVRLAGGNTGKGELRLGLERIVSGWRSRSGGRAELM